jgi:hypothetical protein
LIEAAADPPVDAAAVTVTLPEAIAVTVHAELAEATAADATFGLLDVQLANDGGVVALPPVI